MILEERFSHYEVKAILSSLDYLVGTRFHSVIFALASRVPAIAIEYEHKTSGIMRDLGLEQWVLRIEDVTSGRLVALFEALVQEREEYILQLNEILPDYMTQAAEAARIIARSYEEQAGLLVS